MIIGSGLIARAFKPYEQELAQLCIYAAGVSNSSNTDVREFDREQLRLSQAFQSSPKENLFIYFSTCSVYDPSMKDSLYVAHKLRMEALVQDRPNFLIVRLPQVVGFTPNPHTLFNYLYARITRSERFKIWTGATRNFIDADDVAKIVRAIILQQSMKNSVVNVANQQSTRVKEVVSLFEETLATKAIYDEVDKGSGFDIDITEILPFLSALEIRFDKDYSKNMIEKYYSPSTRSIFY